MEPQIGRPSADSSTPQIRSPQRRDRDAKRSLRRLKPFAPFFALIALSIVIGALNPRFFEFSNLIRVANSAAIPLVLALGMTFVIVLGSIDLSVEGVLAIGAVLSGTRTWPHRSWPCWSSSEFIWPAGELSLRAVRSQAFPGCS